MPGADSAPRRHCVERESLIAAPVDDVWARVTSPTGINHELMPWLSMSVPRGLETLDISTVPVGDPLGRSWLRLGGVLPVDYDDLTIVALEPGRSFHERSRMFSAKVWEHERTLTPVDGGTLLHDRLTFEPRAPLTAGLHARVVGALFTHRHRRVRRHFAA